MSPADTQTLLDQVVVSAFTAGLVGTIVGLCLHGIVTSLLRLWADSIEDRAAAKRREVFYRETLGDD